MKLISEFDNAHEADIAAFHYREKGILTHVSSRYSNGLRMITGATSVGLWVVLEDQYEDAVLLKQNAEHQPKTALTEQAMLDLEAMTKNSYQDSGSKILLWLGYGAAVIALMSYIIHVSYDLLSA